MCYLLLHGPGSVHSLVTHWREFLGPHCIPCRGQALDLFPVSSLFLFSLERDNKGWERNLYYSHEQFQALLRVGLRRKTERQLLYHPPILYDSCRLETRNNFLLWYHWLRYISFWCVWFEIFIDYSPFIVIVKYWPCSLYWMICSLFILCVECVWGAGVWCVLSLVWLFVTPWTVACKDPLSLGFSRQQY